MVNSAKSQCSRAARIFLLLVLPLAACGGSSEATSTSATTSPAAQDATIGQSSSGPWAGRIFFARNFKLYSESYSNTVKTLVDNSLKPASDSTGAIPVLSKSGEHYITYSSDSNVERTDFSLRRTLDAKEVVGFSSTLYTTGVDLSSDARFIAWRWAVDYNAAIKKEIHLSVLELLAPEAGGVRVVSNLIFNGVDETQWIGTTNWTASGKLIYTKRNGDILEFSPYNQSTRQIGKLPDSFGKYKIAPAFITVNPQGDRIAGAMLENDRHSEIWVSNIDGTNLRQHTAVGTAITDIEWSPDGKYIHGGDCRTATGSGANQLDQVYVGSYSWIAASDRENISLAESKQLAATFMHNENADNFMPCAFQWTQ